MIVVKRPEESFPITLYTLEGANKLFLILPDSAQVVEGKLHLLGGGWSQIRPSALPTAHMASLAVGLLVDADETEVGHVFAVRVETPEGGVTDIVSGEFRVGR